MPSLPFLDVPLPFLDVLCIFLVLNLRNEKKMFSEVKTSYFSNDGKTACRKIAETFLFVVMKW